VAKAIALEQAAIRDARVLIVDLSDVPLLSTTVGLAIENVVRDAEASGCAVIVAGAEKKIRERMEGLGLIGPGAIAFGDATRIEALMRALRLLESPSPPPDVEKSGPVS
jgi:anti-anti-sigma regulatory factor